MNVKKIKKRNLGLRKPKIYSLELVDEHLKHHSYRLAWNVQNLRKNKWLSQRELAKDVGIPQAVLSQVESGWANPSLATLVKISKYFKRSVGELFL